MHAIVPSLVRKARGPGVQPYILLFSIAITCLPHQVKVKLPVQLKRSHHLLFTFYHVSCDVQRAAKSSKASTKLPPVEAVGKSSKVGGELCHFHTRIDTGSVPVKILGLES